MMTPLFSTRPTLAKGEWQIKLRAVPWGLVFLLFAIAFTGCMALVSAGEGHFGVWAEKQMARFAFGVGVMSIVAAIEIRRWYRMAYWVFVACAFMLLLVDIFGHIGMGAQRWLNLGFMRVQPSELMKIAFVLALARYYHDCPAVDVKKLKTLWPPLLMVAIPVGLVVVQPDLGTAIKLTAVAIGMLFVAGVPLWLFITGFGIVAAALPLIWASMHDYQRDRVMIFLNPESDPFGAGYHITQSKIAIGSGGFWGKGFLDGTQARLDFLPEKHTDFIFTLWAEEMGLVGGIFLMGLFFMLVAGCILQAMRLRHVFGRLLIFGIAFNLSLYAMINIAMVMGLIPVVGIPLPFVSHGGTAMLSNMIGMGLIISASIHRDSRLPTV